VYRYEEALVIEHSYSKRWTKIDLSNEIVSSLMDTYREVILVLSNTGLDHYLTLKLEDAVEFFNYRDRNETVSQWLVRLGDTALPTTRGTASVVGARVKYKDAFVAGYNCNLAFSKGNPFNDVADDEKDDIILTKEGLDYKLFYEHALVTVNGLIHRTDHDYQGVYLKDGGKSFRVANQNHIGILSFKDVGKIKLISIIPEMLYNPHRVGEFKDSVYIELPEAIGNRIVMMVIGGYLHLIDSNYQQISETVIKVDTANLPLIPRFYESKKLIDLSAMTAHHEANLRNENHISIKDLLKDASIAAYLTLSQSFIVLLEANNLYMQKHKLGYTHLPGRYFTGLTPEWPIRTELGRLPEYIAIRDDALWTLAIQDNFSTRYVSETTEFHLDNSVDNSRISSMPVFYAKGYMLEIGTDKVVLTEKKYTPL
jgi:hypothetical protein